MFTQTFIHTWLQEHRADVAAAALGVACALAVQVQSRAMSGYILEHTAYWRVTNATRVSEASSADAMLTTHSDLVPASSSAESVDSAVHAAAPLSGSTANDPMAAVPVVPADADASSVSVADVPPMDGAVFPVSKTPNWGAQTSPEQWERTYGQIPASEFVPIPRYDRAKLDVTLASLLAPERNVPELTRKLFYSTLFFGQYDLDHAREFTGTHPGLDLKLPVGTPVGACAGGRVSAVRRDDALGLYVIIEHRHPTDGTFFSIYGHLNSVAVKNGDVVSSGQTIGAVGQSGNATAPHLHWQIDIGRPGESHQIYAPAAVPSRDEAEKRVINPVEFVRKYGG